MWGHMTVGVSTIWCIAAVILLLPVRDNEKTSVRAVLISFSIVILVSSTTHATESLSSQRAINNSALIMIEFQNEWLGKKAKLSKLMKDKKQFENSIRQAKRALDAARNTGLPVVHVGLMLNGDYKG